MLFDKYVSKVLEFRKKNCRELVPTGELNAVSSLCYLLEALATPENGVCIYIYLLPMQAQGNAHFSATFSPDFQIHRHIDQSYLRIFRSLIAIYRI